MINTQEEHKDLTLRSAGKMTVTAVPLISPNATIAEVESLLLRKARDLDTINYIYVTDENQKLVGVISVKEVFRLSKDTVVSAVMTKNVVTAKPHTDKQRVALLAIEYNLKEIPVINHENRLLGVVPYNAILKTLHQDHIEEVLRAAGVHKFNDPAQNIITASGMTLIKKRVPWLMLGLLGSAVAATVIGYFRNALENQLLLAAFIPAVTYISDAVGTQSETLFIRTFAIDKNFRFAKYLWRELKVGLAISFILAAAMALISLLIWQNSYVSATLGLTFLISIIFAMAFAIFLPWLFSKTKIDPAIIGGPLDTIVSDIISILIYFTAANIIMGLWL